jgi:hypothetical protein
VGRGAAARAMMRSMTAWEYLILELPQFEPPTHAPGASAAVHALNEEGERGWEAVGIIPLAEGATAVLLKRPRENLS